MVYRFLSQELLNVTWIYCPEESTEHTGSRALDDMDTCTHTLTLSPPCTHTDAHFLPSSHTRSHSQHTCYCLSTKAVLYCESTNSEGKHKPYGGNGRREVLKQINNITCLMNFPIFPWGKNEVKGTSAHLPRYSCQLQFVSSFNAEKEPFPRTIHSLAKAG